MLALKMLLPMEVFLQPSYFLLENLQLNLEFIGSAILDVYLIPIVLLFLPLSAGIHLVTGDPN